MNGRIDQAVLYHALVGSENQSREERTTRERGVKNMLEKTHRSIKILNISKNFFLFLSICFTSLTAISWVKMASITPVYLTITAICIGIFFTCRDYYNEKKERLLPLEMAQLMTMDQE